MKIRELHFPAFGPFTDFRLELPEQPGLVLIYGPNESGKSSALRAVRALLYGMNDTRDAHRHPVERLRVQGRLQHSSGESAVFARRHGRGKKTLLDGQGRPLEAERLEPFLGGLESALFDRLYGLDHQTLSEGGLALLQEGGKVGESLFAAGLGPGYRQVREGLKAEAEQLWKPKSRTKAVDKAVEAYQAAERRAREVTHSAEAWRLLKDQLKEQEERAEAVSQRLEQWGAEAQRLQRLRDAQPPLAQRKLVLQELSPLESLPELPPTFPEQRQRLQGELTTCRAQLTILEQRRQQESERLAQLPSDPPLMAFAEIIDRLHRRLQGREEIASQWPLGQERLEAATRQRQKLARDLGWNDDEIDPQSFPDALQLQTVRRLAESHRSLTQQLETVERRLQDLDSQVAVLDARRHAEGSPPVIEELQESLRQLRGASGLDSELASAKSALAELEANLQQSLRRLSGWSGSLPELVDLAPPGAGEILAYERELKSGESQWEALRSELARVQQQGEELRRRLDARKERGEAHTRAGLRQARQQRDEAWQALLAGDPGSSQAQAQFWQSLVQADQLADYLLENATQVAEMEQLQRDYDESRKHWPQLKARERELQEQFQRREQDWAAAWQSPHLTLQGPVEMRAWLAARDAILNLWGESQRVQARYQAGCQRRAELLAQHRALWDPVLGEPLGPSVEMAVLRAEAGLRPWEQAHQRLREWELESQKLQESRRQQREERRQLEASLEQWRQEWSALVSLFGRQASTHPGDLENLLERYRALREALEQEASLRAQQQRWASDLEDYDRQVQELARELGDPEGEASVAERVERWSQELVAARHTALLRTETERQLQGLSEEQAALRAAVQGLDADWQTLLRSVGLQESDPFATLEEQVQRRRALRDRLRDLEETLASLAGGGSVAELERAVAELDWDGLPGQLQRLSQLRQQGEQERTEALQAVGQLRHQLQRFEGDEAAARAAQEAAEALAEGKELVLRFARLALSEAVLQCEMDRYRRDNEGPVLRAASHWFRRLTCGAYEALRAGLDPGSDRPRLEAVASSGRQVPVEGLSDGTRDQLFLALRLAAVRQLQQDTEPLPMVLDDVLVQFDDQRAQATLGALAEFAQDSQVLLFSHLERDVVLAEALAERAWVLRLEPLER